MKKINVDKIKPGMVLARDVVNQDGRRLLSKDLKLTLKEIRILKMWGISEIIAAQSSIIESSDIEIKENKVVDGKAEKFFDDWFMNNRRKSPVIKTVYDICLDRYANGKFDQSFVFKEEKTPGGSTPNHIKSVTEIQELLSDDLKLPALPTIFSEINEAIQDSNCSGKDIADIVSKDPSLSATLLKIVNSASYGLSEKVESLHYAAMVLGTHQVSSLALGITVINHFKGISNPNTNMESFWRHSIGCAIAAKTLSTYVKGVVAERAFIGGMLHDIGWLVFLTTCPEECNLVFHKAQMLGLNLYQVEQKYFGMNHAKFGSLLARKWNFSDNLTQLIEHHHDTFKSAPSKEVALVYLVNWLVDAIGIGFSGEKMLPKLNMTAWKVLGLSESVLAPTVKQIDRQIVEAVKFFYE